MPSVADLVSAVLSVPDDQLDYARAKLAFDAMIDPAAQAPVIAAELDQLTAQARLIAGLNPDYRRKLSAVRRVIYDAGQWNGGRPFSYDMTDPDGQNLRSAMLSTYLTTRHGTCISMPILFLVLADRLGVAVHLAAAPQHFFVQFIDDAGRRYNLETTSGANVARDEWIRQTLPMSDRAIESGIYMRPLSRREAVSNMALIVVDYLNRAGRYQEMADTAQVILKNAPRDSVALLKVGTAYGHMLDAEFGQYCGDYSRVPDKFKPRFAMLAQRNMDAFYQAEAWGWQDPKLVIGGR